MTPIQSKTNPWLVALIVSIATFMEVLDTTITNVALSHIGGSLAASQDESTWVLTSYLVSNGIILPLSGWLANVFGRKRFFMLCIAGFTAASFACGAATSLGMLVLFRLIQGLAGGGLQPTQQAIILDYFPPEKRGLVFSITGMTLIAAPVLGPTLGGLITDNFSWRWIFFINVPVGLIALFLVNRFVEDPTHAKARGAASIDYIGIGLVAIGLAALQIVLDKGQQEDWLASHFIQFFTCVSIACLVSAVFWLVRQKDAIIDFTLFRDPGFRYSSILIFFTGFVLYSSSALLPLLVQTQYGYDATLAGLVLSPAALAIVLLMPVAGQLVGRFPARYLVMIGLALMATGTYYTSTFTPDIDYNHFVLMRTVQVLGLPFLFIPNSTLAFMNIPREKNNKASALFSLSRNLGGSVGISLVTTYLGRHQQINQVYLSAHTDPTNPVYQSHIADIARTLMAHGMSLAEATQTATGQMYRELLRQSSLLAYQDAFRLMSVLILFGFAIAQFLPKNNPRAKSGAAAAAH